MNMVLKAGSMSVLLRDALRRPLLELELGALEASLRSMPKGVTQVRRHAPLTLYLLKLNTRLELRALIDKDAGVSGDSWPYL